MSFHDVRKITGETLEPFELRPVRRFKKSSSAQLAGAREQRLGDPMAHLGAQAAAGEVLAVRSPHHASIGTNFFHPFRAQLISQFDHLIGDALGLELASKGVHARNSPLLEIQLETVATSGIPGSAQIERRFSSSTNRPQIVSPISFVYSVGRLGAGCWFFRTYCLFIRTSS